MDMDESMRNREAVSALADGQLRGADFARAVELVQQDGDARDAWLAYHVIGDVLRSTELARGAAGGRLVREVARSLRNEPVPPRSVAPGAGEGAASVAVAGAARLQPAANQSAARWKLAAAVASVMAVAAVGWNLLVVPPTAGQGTLAQVAVPAAPQPGAVPASGPAAVAPAVAASVVVVNNEPQLMIRDPRLDELLAAHKQAGGTSALQMPAGFLRNATLER